MINTFYLTPGTIHHLRTAFQKQGSIAIHQFFPPTMYKELMKEVSAVRFQRKCNPLTHSYSQAALPRCIERLFHSAEWKFFLSSLIGKKARSCTGTVYSLTWKDYTLLHDRQREKRGIEFIIDFSDQWPDHAGGSFVFRDAKGNATLVSPHGNCLTLRTTSPRTKSFIQYVNHYGMKQKRIFVRGRVEY